jgi:hypothetical protein
MTSLNRMLAKKMADNKKAKTTAISVALKGGVQEYLIDWLRDLQKDYASSKTEMARHMLIQTRFKQASEIISQEDPGALLELKSVTQTDNNTLQGLSIDGVVVHWSKHRQSVINEERLVVDTSLLLMREMGIE